MGITGLLPLLKSIQKHCTLKKFAGQTIGIDAYGWLHRGTVACAIELALDKPTTKYVDFAMKQVRMLLDFGVTPYLVFDGDALPSKAGTNEERRKRRDEAKTVGMELYKAGKISQAHQEFQKAVPVTPYMARQLIEELKRQNVQYIVAPYEADAQLVYLENKGIIDGILSEDSDMLVFGAKRLLTKLNQYGECVEIQRADFASCREVSLAGWTDDMFRRMAILSGCDYLPNINKMGLKTAYRYIRKHRTTEKALRMIQFDGQLSVPAGYEVKFLHAELTFLYHRVFCPVAQQLAHLTPLEKGMKVEDMPFLGPDVPAETAIGVACGDLHPKSKELIRLKNVGTSSRPPAQGRSQSLSLPATLKPKTSIDSFFKARRQPLAELDPNSLTPSPSQQRLLEIHSNASWEPRVVRSAPQLRRSATALPASDGLITNTRVDRNAFLARAAAMSTYQPPKRQRLCSEGEEGSPSKEIRESRFFDQNIPEPSPSAMKKGRSKKAKKAEFDIYSDDVWEEALRSIPDVQQLASPEKKSSHGLTGGSSDRYGNADPEDGRSVIRSSPLAPSKSQGIEDVSTESSFTDKQNTSYPDISQITEATSISADDEVEEFEDLLELHVRKQNEALLKTFAFQSPEGQTDALKSLILPAEVVLGQQTAPASTAQQPSPSLPRTLTAPLSQQQNATLKSLKSTQPCVGNTADDGLSVRSTTLLQQSDQQALGKTKSNAEDAVVSDGETNPPALLGGAKGSEDQIVPNSDDEISESGSPRRRILDLKAFVYTRE